MGLKTRPSTGLRRSEALGLRCEDVNLTEGYVLIRASLSLSRERGLILEPPKTESGRRRVDLDGATVVDVLRLHRERQDEVKRTMRDGYEDRGRFLREPTGSGSIRHS